MKKVADSRRRRGVKRISNLIYEGSGGIHIVVVVSNVSLVLKGMSSPCFVPSWLISKPFPAIHDAPCSSSSWLHHVNISLDLSMKMVAVFTSSWWCQMYLRSYLWRGLWIADSSSLRWCRTYLWSYLSWRGLRIADSQCRGGVKHISGLIYEGGCGFRRGMRQCISGLIYEDSFRFMSLRWCQTYLWSYLWRRLRIQKRVAESHHRGGVKCIYYYFLYSVDCIYLMFAILIVFYFLSRKRNLMTMSLGSVPT